MHVHYSDGLLSARSLFRWFTQCTFITQIIYSVLVHYSDSLLSASSLLRKFTPCTFIIQKVYSMHVHCSESLLGACSLLREFTRCTFITQILLITQALPVPFLCACKVILPIRLYTQQSRCQSTHPFIYPSILSPSNI